MSQEQIQPTSQSSEAEISSVPQSESPVTTAATAPSSIEPSQKQAASEADVVPEENEEANKEPPVVPANATHGGRETSDRVLYVGNLDKSITEDILKQYFQVAGQIVDVKVMIDKKSNYVNYAFVEYAKAHDASVALQTLNGIQIENNKVKINRAFQSQQSTTDDSTFNLFVGDLNIDIDDDTLSRSFKDFPSYIQAHVMWDMQTGRSRGYGFVSFADQEQAQKAMEEMQGKELNGRPIRINWATKRDNNQQQNHGGPRRGGFRNNNNNRRGGMMQEPQVNIPIDGMPPQMVPPQPMVAQSMTSAIPFQDTQQGAPMGALPPVNPQAVDDMIRRAPPRVSTAYIGNIPHFATEADLIPLLQSFGFILDFTHYPEKGCCFIKYDTHEQAAVCIVALANFNFQGRNLRTGWGKERNTFAPPQQQQAQPGMMPVMMGEQQPPQQQQ
ncbi:Pub1p KNAG_0A05440 [Huiozyma naganishii CBS 8797]|uniref:RRM domain-containing protein n=1 Tax=Huiozyma naganishii (strain ATCC MYA-139 / BCRC 22969 / CBS 8797 / KCTC 17520 / NBRC 10181 / NCYC 3082 / Yp74L-3) TaxID=1071383 RepID=J7S2J5_HUIN7|nr:hypothetical protein KNAG_0A05440 [Kazachstania naganishii CBS 8797]CCK68209.1 hypothetical protein KNAG_0A05440 [Kazachstania naganishii CBS 8797]